MKSIEKHDDQFVEHAMNDEARQTLIRHSARLRNLFQILATLSTVIGLGSAGICWLWKSNLSSTGTLAMLLVVATFQWILTFKYESDLRLLKVIEKLKK